MRHNIFQPPPPPKRNTTRELFWVTCRPPGPTANFIFSKQGHDIYEATYKRTLAFWQGSRDPGPGFSDSCGKQAGRNLIRPGGPGFLQTHLNGCIKSSFKQTNHLMNSLTFNLFCFILLYKIMLLISRFESYLKMCGFEMGCDTKWKKSQIEKSQNSD